MDTKIATILTLILVAGVVAVVKAARAAKHLRQQERPQPDKVVMEALVAVLPCVPRISPVRSFFPEQKIRPLASQKLASARKDLEYSGRDQIRSAKRCD